MRRSYRLEVGVTEAEYDTIQWALAQIEPPTRDQIRAKARAVGVGYTGTVLAIVNLEILAHYQLRQAEAAIEEDAMDREDADAGREP